MSLAIVEIYGWRLRFDELKITMIRRVDFPSKGYVVYAQKMDQYEKAKRDWEKAASLYPSSIMGKTDS